MSLRIDWNQILDRIGSVGSTEPILFLLPAGGRELLLSVAPRLTWEATFRVGDYDYADWDELQAIVSLTEYGLMSGVPMQDLIDAINNQTQQLSNAIAGIDFSCPDITLQACNSLSNGDFPDEPPDTIPTYQTAPPSTPEPQTGTYEEYKCKATHKYLDATRNLIDNLIDLTLQQSPYTWLYNLLTTEEFGNPVYQVLIAIFNFLTANTYGLLKADILALFDELEQDFLCAIFASETPADAFGLIEAIIDASGGGFVVRYLLRLFVIDSTTLSPIWVEDQVDVTGYDGAVCECYAPENGFVYDEPYDANLGLWGNPSGGFGWRNNGGDGEMYTLGHVNAINRGINRTTFLSLWGEVHGDVEAWYLETVTLYIRRNTAQAVETDVFCRFYYRDGTYADVVKPVSIGASEVVCSFVNPNPGKELWDSQSQTTPGFSVFFPGVAGASSWYEYWWTRAVVTGGYNLGTYTDYGDPNA